MSEQGRRERQDGAAAPPPQPRRIAGVILAAGLSRRMGSAKAALRIADETFIARIARRMRALDADPLLVVASEHAEAVRDALGALARPAGPVEILVNPRPERGQLASLKCAIEDLERRAHARIDAALVTLVDHPLVAARTYRRLADAAAQGDHTIVVPAHDGRRGHPVCFRREVWRELLATPDEQGARAVVRRDPSRVLVIEVEDDGILLDIDTPADLAALRARSPKRP